jgi:hypothetical protein
MTRQYIGYYEKYGKKWQQNHKDKCHIKGLKFYYAHREKILLNMREKKDEKRQYIQDYKLSKGCAICGYNKCADALCFHHNGDKKFAIGDAIGQCKSLENIKKEMDKCIVLCMNCHAELHQKED